MAGFQNRANDICDGFLRCGREWLSSDTRVSTALNAALARARIMNRRPIKVAAVALANKIARIAWAMMVRGERFRRTEITAGSEFLRL